MTHTPLRPLQLDDPWASRPGPMLPADEEQVFCPAGPLSLQDVVDRPARSLFVEYKAWRNLRNPEDQAEIARDIAALANAGGGAIVFGFVEDTLAPADLDPFRTVCDDAALAAILGIFLDPAPHCEMLSVHSASGIDCAVIRVGAHGTTPVFIRPNGLPPAGLRVLQPGAVYVRRHTVPRPGQLSPLVESAPVGAPAEWLPLLRRCLRADRETMLGAIEAAIEGRCQPADGAGQLRAFHDAARASFLALTGRVPSAAPLAARHRVLSYALDLGRPEQLEPAQMPELLSRAVFGVQQQIRAGAPMFDPPYRRAARPRFISDPALEDDEAEVLETAWLEAALPAARGELWRVSARGLASLVRPYAEDEFPPAADEDAPPGPWLSPNLLARDLTELVLHARGLARLFASARAVTFRCGWTGLAGRRIYDPAVRWAHREVALADSRTVTLQVPLATLVHGWAEPVARLMAPVLRMIEPDLALGPEWVREQASGWR